MMDYVNSRQYELAITQQIALVFEHGLLAEKRTNEIFALVLESPNNFHLINAVLDFTKVGKKAFDKLSKLVALYKKDKKIYGIEREDLLQTYEETVLRLMPYKKVIQNEIIMNALKGLQPETDVSTEQQENELKEYAKMLNTEYKKTESETKK